MNHNFKKTYLNNEQPIVVGKLRDFPEQFVVLFKNLFERNCSRMTDFLFAPSLNKH